MQASQRLLAANGLATFAFLGAIQAIYGPLVPGLKQTFAIDTSEAGLVFTAHGGGALVGILIPALLRANWLASHWLGVATGLLMLGATGLLLAPSWPAMLGAAFVLALGFGIHVVRLNSLFVAGFGTRGMTMSQLINAAFSIGSILGPIALGLSGGPSRSIFGGVALLALALLPVNLATDARVKEPGSRSGSTANHSRRPAESRTVLAAFVVMLCLVSGVENSIAGWTATLALARGYTYAEAANLTALFFGAVLGGRLIAAGLGRRARAGLLVVTAVAGAALLLALAGLTALGPDRLRTQRVRARADLLRDAHLGGKRVADVHACQRCRHRRRAARCGGVSRFDRPGDRSPRRLRGGARDPHSGPGSARGCAVAALRAARVINDRRHA